MICPQDNTKCACLNSALCEPPNNHQPKTDLGKRLIDLRAKAVAEGMPIEEHKPSLAEIERLAMDLEGCVEDDCFYSRPTRSKSTLEARAALMAAIRAYGEG